MKRLAAFVALLVAAACGRAAVPAFPGAEGFGAYATGGRSGDVYHVINLSGSASTPGSFAYGLANAPASGRTIVFDVSGNIPVSGNLTLGHSRITIAGQTAPGDGVGLISGTFWITGSENVIRHFRFRNGQSADCIDITSSATNTILDHCDVLFSKDENFSSFGSPPENLTFQWSANAWGLYSHSAGGLWDVNHATAHHTLWAHNHTRDPKAHPDGLLDWINNVTCDYGIGFIMGDSTATADWKANVEGCYFVCPPGNVRPYALSRAGVDSHGAPNFSLWLTNCLWDKDGDSILNGFDPGWSMVSVNPTNYHRMSNAIPRTHGIPVTQDPPLTAYKKIVSAVGPLRLDANHPEGLRDEVAAELIKSVVTWRMDRFDSVADTGASGGGYGTLNSTPAPADTDRDGMPDFWESALGSNPTVDDHTNAVPANAFIPNNPAGYTLLEEYLHFRATPHAGRGTVVCRQSHLARRGSAPLHQRLHQQAARHLHALEHDQRRRHARRRQRRARRAGDEFLRARALRFYRDRRRWQFVDTNVSRAGVGGRAAAGFALERGWRDERLDHQRAQLPCRVESHGVSRWR